MMTLIFLLFNVLVTVNAFIVTDRHQAPSSFLNTLQNKKTFLASESRRRSKDLLRVNSVVTISTHKYKPKAETLNPTPLNNDINKITSTTSSSAAKSTVGLKDMKSEDIEREIEKEIQSIRQEMKEKYKPKPYIELPTMAYNRDFIDDARYFSKQSLHRARYMVADSQDKSAALTYFLHVKMPLYVDPLYHVEQAMAKAQGDSDYSDDSADEYEYMYALKNLLQRGNGRLSLKTNKIAVLEKGGNAVGLMDGNIAESQQSFPLDINPRELPENGQRQYQIPTWSPDGKYLAFTELLLSTNGLEKVWVVIYEMEGRREVGRQLLNVAPHLLQFMSDGDNIMYVANKHDTIACFGMFSVSALLAGRDDNRILDEGAPLFLSSTKHHSTHFNIAVHNGKKGGLYRWLGNAVEDGWQFIAPSERRFRAPELHSAGLQDAIVYAADGYLQCVSIDGVKRKKTVRINGFATFAVSPNGRYTALMEEDSARGVYRMSILRGRGAVDPYCDEEFEQEFIEVKHVIAAFYFSPDSEKLLLMTTTSPSHEFSVTRNTMNLGVSLTCRWQCYYLRDRRMLSYGLFNPRPYALKAFVPFFDQYRHALSPWSPDSDYFCFTQRDGGFIQPLIDPTEIKRYKKNPSAPRPLPFPKHVENEVEVMSWSWN